MRAGLSDSAAYFFRGSGGRPAIFCAAWCAPGDAVLFKGSRGVRVEKALERVLGQGVSGPECFIGFFTRSSIRTSAPFRVFRYITFRTAFASLTALFLCIALGPWLIGKLREFQIGQYIREDGPKSHQKKAGTPTMGGVLIMISIVIPTLLWADLRQSLCLDRAVQRCWLSARSALSTTTRRSRKQRNLGLTGGRSCCTQMLVALRAGRRFCWCMQTYGGLHHHDERSVPQTVSARSADSFAPAATRGPMRWRLCRSSCSSRWWWWARRTP